MHWAEPAKLGVLAAAVLGGILLGEFSSVDSGLDRPDPSAARQFANLIGTHVSTAERYNSPWVFGSLIYLAEPTSKCSLSAHLPGTEDGGSPISVYFVFPDAYDAKHVAKPSSNQIKVLFGMDSFSLPRKLFHCAPLLIHVDSASKIRAIYRPLRIESVSELKKLAGVPQ